MLAQHLNYATPAHVEAARYMVNYIKGCKSLGIKFTMQQSNDISAFLNYPLPPNKLCALTDDNWGSQDASDPDPSSPPKHLDLFKLQ